MAGPWEDYGSTTEAGPWTDFASKQPAAPPAPRTGAAAIPTQAEAQGKPYVAPAPVAPPAPPTFADKITGAVQAGLNLATGLVGGLVGGVSGTAESMKQGLGVIGSAVARKVQGLPAEETPDRPNLEQLQAEHSAGVTGALKRTVSGPMDLRQPQTPDTALGEQYTEALQPAMDTVMAAAPLHGTMGPTGGVRAGVDAMRRASGASPEAFVANAALEKAGDVVKTGARKVLNVDPELAKVAQLAGEQKYPIDVRPDQIVEGAKFTKLAGQAASDVPLSGSKKSSNQVAFTRNLIDMLNPEETTADRLTPDVFDKAMTRSGEGIGEITARTPVPESDITHGIESVRNSLSKATEDNRRIVTEYLNDIQNAAAENDGVLDGTRLKEINSEIGKQARSNADNDLGRYLNNLQDVIQDSVERNAKPEDIQPLRDFRRQYAYGKMVEPLVAKTIDGKVSPVGLMARVTATKQGKHYMARSMGGPIGDLAKVGQLIKEPSSSGTAERGLVYGGLLGGGAYVEPHTAAAAYGGAAAYNTLGPKLTRALVGKREKGGAAVEPPPAEPTTSPGAGGDQGGGGGAPPAGPLGDLTPEWETTPGAGGGAPRGGNEPGLVPAVGETTITRFVPNAAEETPRRAAGSEIPAVPGRPDLPDSMLTGRPAESAGTERSNAAMLEPGTQEAMRHAEVLRQEGERAKIPVGEAREVPLGEGVREPETPKKIPAGKVIEGQPEIKTSTPKKIPTGEATEITPEKVEPAPEPIPTGEVYEMTPEQELKWRDEFKLGGDDAARAKDVAQALAHDEKAVEAAVKQHEDNPRAFEREIARINEEGKRHVDEAEQAARSSTSNADSTSPAGAPGGGDGAAPVSGSEGHGDGAAPVREAAAQPEPAPAVRTAAEQSGANGAGAAGAERGGADAASGQGEVTKRRVKSDDGVHTEVTLPDGSVRRIQRLNSTESMGLPGWHDMDAKGRSYLGSTEADAIKALTDKEPPEEVFKTGADRKVAGTPEALESALREKFGDKLVQGLLDQGVLKFALARDEGMVGERGGVQAVMREGGGKPSAATLYFDRLTPEEAPGVLMHELGEHFGIVRMLGEDRYKVMLGDLKALRDTPEVRDAWAEVRKNYTGDGPAGFKEGDASFLREVAAHLVENHPDLPFVRRMINEIRAFFYENFGTTMGNRVDANLVRGLAASALRKASQGELPKMREPVPFVPRNRANNGAQPRP